MSETVASARILDRPSSHGWGILEPDNGLSIKSKDGLLVGRTLVKRTLVNLSAEKVPIHLMNLTSQPKRIKKGTEVAICSTVESVLIQDNDIILVKERNLLVENGSVLVEGKTLEKDSASLIESSKENICHSEPDVCGEEHSSKPDGCLSAGAARKSDSVKPVAEESLKSGVCLLSGAAICSYSTKALWNRKRIW